MKQETPLKLFDERDASVRLLDEVLNRRRDPLTAASQAARHPGAYLLFGAPPHYEDGPDPYRRVRDGCWPVYAGVAALELAERLGRHLIKARSISGMVDAMLMLTVPCVSVATAAWAERVLITAFRPAWNEPWLSGWGSKPCGAHRVRQRRNSWDSLHRAADRRHHREDVAALRRRLEAHLAATVPLGGAWAT